MALLITIYRLWVQEKVRYNLWRSRKLYPKKYELTVVKSNQEPLSNKQVLKKKKRETNSFKTQYVYSG